VIQNVRIRGLHFTRSGKIIMRLITREMLPIFHWKFRYSVYMRTNKVLYGIQTYQGEVWIPEDASSNPALDNKFFCNSM
jgi:hypothetical protein